MSAETLIEVTIDQSNYPCFTIGGQEYHITLKGDVLHVTTKDRGKHYGYKTEQSLVDGNWRTIITGKKIENGCLFEQLPQNVQDFIQKNYDQIMRLGKGQKASFPL